MTRATSSRRTSTRRFQGMVNQSMRLQRRPLVPPRRDKRCHSQHNKGNRSYCGVEPRSQAHAVLSRGENDDLTAARTPAYLNDSLFAPPSFLFINLLLSLARLSGLLDPHFQIFGVFQFVQYRGSRRRREAAAQTWPRQRPVRIVKVTLGSRTLHNSDIP